MNDEEIDKSDLETWLRDRVEDVRELVEVNVGDEILTDLPAAHLYYWDKMHWLLIPMPGRDEFRLEVVGFIDGRRDHGPTEMILRR